MSFVPLPRVPSTVLPNFDFALYRPDRSWIGVHRKSGQVLYRPFLSEGRLLIQKYNLSEQQSEGIATSPPSCNLPGDAVHLFFLKKWLISVTFWRYHQEIEPAVLSRLLAYKTYYEDIEREWLDKNNPYFLHKWWEVEITTESMHHTPGEVDDPVDVSTVDEAITKAQIMWQMGEIWQANDPLAVSTDAYEVAYLYLCDWIKQGIYANLGTAPYPRTLDDLIVAHHRTSLTSRDMEVDGEITTQDNMASEGEDSDVSMESDVPSSKPPTTVWDESEFIWSPFWSVLFI